MRFLPCADQGLLVGTGSLDEALALYRALAESPPAGVEDLVPAARTVLLRLAPGADPARVEQAVRGLEPGGPGPAPASWCGFPWSTTGRTCPASRS